MARQKITTAISKTSIEKEYGRNQRNFGKGFLKDVSVGFAYSQFAVYQLTKGNSMRIFREVRILILLHFQVMGLMKNRLQNPTG